MRATTKSAPSLNSPKKRRNPLSQNDRRSPPGSRLGMDEGAALENFAVRRNVFESLLQQQNIPILFPSETADQFAQAFPRKPTSIPVPNDE